MKSFRPALFLVAALAAFQLDAQTPEWLWFQKTDGTDVRFFRKSFEVAGKVSKAELAASGDDEMEVFLNGESVLKNKQWRSPARAVVTEKLRAGKNILAIRAANRGSSSAGAFARLEIVTDAGRKFIVTDPSWKASASEAVGWRMASFDDSGWAAPKSLGAMGVKPWGRVLGEVQPADGGKQAKAKQAKQAKPRPGASQGAPTAPEALFALPGFHVELLASATPEEGSWVSMAKDSQGRLLISPQWGKAENADEEKERGLLRVTLGPDGKVTKRELFARKFYDAQGLVFHQGAIYAVVNKYSTKFASGLYRLRDPKGDGSFDDIQLLKEIPGGGEHGPHAVEPGPDGKLYVMAGNHTKLVNDVAASSPHRNYQEDHLLPRQWDANGHATGILAPGGHIYRTDFEGKNWELFCAGFRNQYDFSFNADGEIFVYDSDMEWEWGTHWYRPTRVYHTPSGADVGWRSGSAKWPSYYPDGTPPVLDVGVGCPTGTKFGYGAKFPAKYQRAYYILDWTYGRILAVHLTPNGASYRATMENFICPLGLLYPASAAKKPLNVTDLEIGADGAMYFTVGGRNTQAGLYRVTYVGNEGTAPAKLIDSRGADARKLRRELEAFHGKEVAGAVGFAWKHLGSGDRAVRYAARLALESQPLYLWKAAVMAEGNSTAGLTALLALARVGGRESQLDCLTALDKWPLASLPEDKQLEKLRVLEVSFARHGKPSAGMAESLALRLGAQYPARSFNVNQELVQLLVFLEAPGTVKKTLALLEAAPTQEQQFAYLFHLRTLAGGWTLEQRQHYFTALNRYPNPQAKHEAATVEWFTSAGRDFADGNSFRKQLDKIRDDAIGTLSAAERTQLAGLISVRAAGPAGEGKGSFPEPKARTFAQEWKMTDLAASLDQVKKGRDFGKGRQAFVDAQCIACHKMGNEGGGVGPELTAIAARFASRDILESILEPSKVVSEQFQNTTVVKQDGDDVTGRLVDETDTELVLMPNQLQPDNRVTVKKSDVRSRTFSKLSPMPEGLVNVLSREEILDLAAFLEAGGRRGEAFGK
ncbi:MAG: c-type cytochrome [Verrucomicrobia bacterium]|nr:c-type cytochrome [Verrucomicrobiota bacterium]